MFFKYFVSDFASSAITLKNLPDLEILSIEARAKVLPQYLIERLLWLVQIGNFTCMWSILYLVYRNPSLLSANSSTSLRGLGETVLWKPLQKFRISPNKDSSTHFWIIGSESQAGNMKKESAVFSHSAWPSFIPLWFSKIHRLLFSISHRPLNQWNPYCPLCSFQSTLRASAAFLLQPLHISHRCPWP